MNTMKKNILSLLALCLASLTVTAQQAVKIGEGSYASFPPASKGWTQHGHGGDQSTWMQTRELNINENRKTPDGRKRPLPTNDWWTGLLVNSFSDGLGLWTYPQEVKTIKGGIRVNYPSYWIDSGEEMKSRTHVLVGGKGFSADSCIVDDWHDWDVEVRLKDRSGKHAMLATLVQGMPFTWVETSGLQPEISFSATPSFVDARGQELTGAEITGGRIAVKVGDDLYGLYFNPDVAATVADGRLLLQTTQRSWVVVALLHQADELDAWAPYACSKPVSTAVSWSYDEQRAAVTSSFHIDAVNLLDPRGDAPVMQGFLPHHYRGNATAGLNLDDNSWYRTPRGKMIMGCSDSGRSHTFSYRQTFTGMLPYFPQPADTAGVNNPFKPALMKQLMDDYAGKGTFGGDTYWGGKGLTQMALNMTFAYELGDSAAFRTARNRLRAALENWLTYTPGESDFFFARYPRWGALVGMNTSYSSDSFNDHHFHYGYFTYAGALLCMFDADFRNKYGQMLTLVAKEYANWDRNDADFPFFRTFSPWFGHSFAGGMGDGLNDNGNGQESSSEAMQSWGGLYLLGVALNNKEMRDAGIYGYATESRAVAEYWFDRGHVIDGVPQKTADIDRWNYDYSRYTRPYNSNLTCKGIGWWTWFSGDNIWMHSIQWMPVSPCLNYLSEDLSFARWDYQQMMGSTQNQWLYDGSANDLANQSLGNVVLSYMERFDPDEAAAIFDKAWNSGKDLQMVRAIDTGHISYYALHSHRTYGDYDFSVTADIPTASVYRNAAGVKTYVVYNPEDRARTVTFSDGHVLKEVPGRSLTVNGDSHRIVSDDNALQPVASRPDLVYLTRAGIAGATATSTNGGADAGKMIDGIDHNAANRWESVHGVDDVAVTLSLDGVYTLKQLRISWEAAYASAYDIQVSRDGRTWTTVKQVTLTGNTFRNDVENLDAEASYVRLQLKNRATQYGYSIYEIYAFGYKADAPAGTTVAMHLAADSTYVDQGRPVMLSAVTVSKADEGAADLKEKLDAAHAQLAAAPQPESPFEWTVTRTADGVVVASSRTNPFRFVPESYGSYDVTAACQGQTGTLQIVAAETLSADSINVTPAAATLLPGDKQTVTVRILNQFNGLVSRQDSVFTAGEPGVYNLVFRVPGNDALTDTCRITVRPVSEMNLALNKPATASSEGMPAARAFDGDENTRWEGLHGDADSHPELTVDLQGLYKINRMKIKWENAYATSYTLLYSTDGVTWQTLRDVEKQDASTDTINDSFEARYLRMHTNSKYFPGYSVSIYEWEVYGTEKIRQMFLDTERSDNRRLVFTGTWEDEVFDASDSPEVCAVDLTRLAGLPQVTPAVYNPNVLFFVNDGADMKGFNTVSPVGGNRYHTASLSLFDGCDFMPFGHQPATADGALDADAADLTAGAATFSLEVTPRRYHIVVLPFKPTEASLADMIVYKIGKKDEAGLHLTRISAADIVPGEPCIMRSETGGAYLFRPAAGAVIATVPRTVPAVDGVTLHGTMTAVDVPAGAWVTDSTNTLKRVEAAGVRVAAFGGYVTLDGAAGSSQLPMQDDDDATGITTVTPHAPEHAGTDRTWNLSGQRVADGYRGLVLKKGVKIFRR